MNDDRSIELDKRGIVFKLAFLVGRTLLMHSSNGFEAVKVNSIKVNDGSDTELFIYTTNGVLRYFNVDWMKDTFLLTDNGMKSLKTVADELEIYF